MAINRNLGWEIGGLGRVEGSDTPPAKRVVATGTGITRAAEAALPPTPMATASAPMPSVMGVQTPTSSVPAAVPVANVLPVMTRDLGPLFVQPGIVDFRPGVSIAPHNKTTTQIAQAAISQLTVATPAALREAVTTVKNKNVAADDLLNYLERKTRVGEVLNELATDWSEQTTHDFAEAFQMAATPDKLPVMDSIVSISILNDPELRGELQAENTTEASQADLMENRRIVWQWPEPGTPFTPPYLLMVAVERQDTTQAQNVIQSILGNLVEFEGYKLPRAAAQKLGGRTVSSQVLTANLAATTLRRGNQ